MLNIFILDLRLFKAAKHIFLFFNLSVMMEGEKVQNTMFTTTHQLCIKSVLFCSDMKPESIRNTTSTLGRQEMSICLWFSLMMNYRHYKRADKDNEDNVLSLFSLSLTLDSAQHQRLDGVEFPVRRQVEVLSGVLVNLKRRESFPVFSSTKISCPISKPRS